MKRLAAICAAGALLFLPVGCGESPEDEVRAVVEDFTAEAATNAERSCRHFAQDTRKACRVAALLSEETFSGLLRAQVVRVAVEDRVAVAALDDGSVVNLRREPSGWVLEKIDDDGPASDDDSLPTPPELKNCLSDAGVTKLKVEGVREDGHQMMLVLGIAPSEEVLGVLLTEGRFADGKLVRERRGDYKQRPAAGNRAIVFTAWDKSQREYEIAQRCLEPR